MENTYYTKKRRNAIYFKDIEVTCEICNCKFIVSALDQFRLEIVPKNCGDCGSLRKKQRK